MRILVVCQYYYPENVVITPICESLVRRGHDVFVVTGKPNYGFGKILPAYRDITDETIHGVTVHRLALHPRKDSKISLILNYLSFWRHAKRYLSYLKDDYDVVYAMSMSPLISVEGGCRYGKKHGVPTLVHCLDLWPESAVAAGKIKRSSLAYHVLYRWSKRIYSAYDRILISSPSFEKYFREVIRLKDKPITVIPQPPLVTPLPAQGIVYAKPINIVYAGNIGHLQMVDKYVEACEEISSSDFQFHIIGSGSSLSDIKELIRQRHLEDKVICYGQIPSKDIASYFVNATALVVSLQDSSSPVAKTIPNKLVSSLYYGKPILASIGGDGKNVLSEAGGSFFASDTPESIADSIRHLIDSSPEKREELGKKNRAYFDAHYDFESVMNQLENQLKDCKKA